MYETVKKFRLEHYIDYDEPNKAHCKNTGLSHSSYHSNQKKTNNSSGNFCHWKSYITLMDIICCARPGSCCSSSAKLLSTSAFCFSKYSFEACWKAKDISLLPILKICLNCWAQEPPKKKKAELTKKEKQNLILPFMKWPRMMVTS